MFSFRNDFLAENNVYNPKIRQLDETKLRDAMNDFTSKMGMNTQPFGPLQFTRELQRVVVEDRNGCQSKPSPVLSESQPPRFNGSLTKISNSDRLAGYPRDPALMSSIPLMA
jgi:hypothetical protein